MSNVKLYGIAASRAFRSLWAAEEIGLDYDHVPTHFRGDAQTDEYRAVNPNARIPALVEGDVKLFESMAINLYLARRYGDGLVPADAAGEAQVFQWSVWAISEIEPLQMQIVIQTFFTPEDKRDAAVIERAAAQLARPLGVLDAHLEDRNWLLGDSFTLADLNLAAVMDLLGMVQFDLSAHGNVTRWLDACRARPSYAAAKALGEQGAA